MDGAKFNFRITAYTPETIPMGRLAEYMALYAALMGSDAHVHFEKLTSGSTVLRARVEDEDIPKVENRLHLVGGTDAPADIVKTYDEINNLLRKDHAEGTVKRVGGGQVIKFPGYKLPLPQIIGPIKEAGYLEGEIVRVGGRDRTIHIQLLGPDGETYNLTTTSRDTAKELGKLLFAAVRVNGTGTWTRNENGQWELGQFAIQDFEPISDRTLIEALAGLREVEGSDWEKVNDPLAKWRELRRD